MFTVIFDLLNRKTLKRKAASETTIHDLADGRVSVELTLIVRKTSIRIRTQGWGLWSLRRNDITHAAR